MGSVIYTRYTSSTNAYNISRLWGQVAHALHTQPFYNDGTLVQGLQDAGFRVVSTEMMHTRMGPTLEARLKEQGDNRYAPYQYEQRVLAYKHRAKYVDMSVSQ